jgi:hypothetical protein
MAITLRSVKGSNLTPTEVDANFTTLVAAPNTTITTGRAITAADHNKLIPGIHATNDIDCTLGLLTTLPMIIILGKMGSGTGRISIQCSGGVTIDGISNPLITSTVPFGTIVLEAYANDAYYQVA